MATMGSIRYYSINVNKQDFYVTGIVYTAQVTNQPGESGNASWEVSADHKGIIAM